VQVEGPLIASEHGIAITAANDGAGIVQLPLAYVAAELAAGRMVADLADWANRVKQRLCLDQVAGAKAVRKAAVDGCQ